MNAAVQGLRPGAFGVQGARCLAEDSAFDSQFLLPGALLAEGVHAVPEFFRRPLDREIRGDLVEIVLELFQPCPAVAT